MVARERPCSCRWWNVVQDQLAHAARVGGEQLRDGGSRRRAQPGGEVGQVALVRVARGRRAPGQEAGDQLLGGGHSDRRCRLRWVRRPHGLLGFHAKNGSSCCLGLHVRNGWGRRRTHLSPEYSNESLRRVIVPKRLYDTAGGAPRATSTRRPGAVGAGWGQRSSARIRPGWVGRSPPGLAPRLPADLERASCSRSPTCRPPRSWTRPARPDTTAGYDRRPEAARRLAAAMLHVPASCDGPVGQRAKRGELTAGVEEPMRVGR